MRAWFMAKSIRKQLATLAIGTNIFVTILALLTQPFTPREYLITTYTQATAAQIELVVAQVRASATPGQTAAILDAVNKTGLRVELVPESELLRQAQTAPAKGDIRELLQQALPPALQPVVRNNTQGGDLTGVILVRLDDTNALAFAPALAGPDVLISDTHVDRLLMVLVVVLPVLFLTLYASRMITAPLTRFVDAAQSINPDTGPDRPFSEEGTLEIAKLARSLNDLHSRIRTMIDARTRMLRAISHDLRTPLTRLRLRAERSTQPELSAAMLGDINRIAEMIEETLAFLRNDVSAEQPVNADLPSLLQTVCTDFTDFGFPASYVGPDRLAYPCKPLALTRAISNLVENSTKFAEVAVVRLAVNPVGWIVISVEDDGPGIPAELRQKVLEPFFKACAARTTGTRGSFGLGLSIVSEIVSNHGGDMRLLQSEAGGLLVEISLPPISAEIAPLIAHMAPVTAENKRQLLPAPISLNIT